eukprot:15447842-Alexandrium_andersonii.AAC.1
MPSWRAEEQMHVKQHVHASRAWGDTEGPKWGCHGEQASAWHRWKLGWCANRARDFHRGPLAGLPWEAKFGMAQVGNW